MYTKRFIIVDQMTCGGRIGIDRIEKVEKESGTPWYKSHSHQWVPSHLLFAGKC